MPCAALHSRKCACNQARPHLAGADGRPGRRQEGPVAHCASIQLFIHRYLRKILQASRAGQRHSSFSHAAPAVHQNQALNQRMTASSRLLMIMTGGLSRSRNDREELEPPPSARCIDPLPLLPPTTRCSAARIDTSEQSSANKSPQISEAQCRLRISHALWGSCCVQTRWVHCTALRIAGFAACLREREIAVNLPLMRAGTMRFRLSRVGCESCERQAYPCRHRGRNLVDFVPKKLHIEGKSHLLYPQPY